MSGLFTQLSALLSSSDELAMHIKHTGGDKLEVIVLSKLKDNENLDDATQNIRAGLCTPIVICDSVGELDKSFVTLLEDIASDRKRLNSQYDRAREVNDEVLAKANNSCKAKVSDKDKSSNAPQKPISKETVKTASNSLI